VSISGVLSPPRVGVGSAQGIAANVRTYCDRLGRQRRGIA